MTEKAPQTSPDPETRTSSENDEANKPENKRQALIRERREMNEKIEEMKTEKLRRQLEEMKAEFAEEDAPPPDATANAPEHKAAVKNGLLHVSQARLQLRHYLGLISFVLMVVVPTLFSAWYMYNRAHDRYVSYVGFSVRTEEISSALDLLGGMAGLSGSSSSDTDIIYKFIQSPELVAMIDAKHDLRTIWSRPGTDWSDSDADPFFAYNPDKNGNTIEELTSYWQRMVGVYSDSGTGLIDVEVEAFTPQDSRDIALTIYEESTAMINRLSAIAREDGTRYAREELDKAVERLKTAREALTRFRNETQIVDPSASIQGQQALLNSLQAQLAQAVIDLDMLHRNAREGDLRITQAEQRVEVIEGRIEDERRKLGFGSERSPGDPAAGTAFADLIGEYERLAVDAQFAEQSYTTAMAAYDSAVAEAQRQTRYLAAHVNPTLPEAATRPNRLETVLKIAGFAFLIWAASGLVLYAIRDRR